MANRLADSSPEYDDAGKVSQSCGLQLLIGVVFSIRQTFYRYLQALDNVLALDPRLEIFFSQTVNTTLQKGFAIQGASRFLGFELRIGKGFLMIRSA